MEPNQLRKSSKIMSFKIKNHITPNAKTIAGILQKTYGLDLSDLDKALQGDKQALKAIGEAGRQGRQIQELMPLLLEAYGHLIKGTEEYNKGVSGILKQGASSAISIDKAGIQAELANKKYRNQRTESAAELIAGREAENTRHEYAINYIQLKAYIDQYITTVDGDGRILDQTNRPQLRQIQEDTKFELNAAKALLSEGENARLEFIPRREYVPTESSPKTPKVEQSKGIMQSLGRIVSALGF